MALPTPKLDDCTFQNLVDEAKRRIPKYCPGWTDHNVSDPGITLIELFAYMTEQYLYRLNQVPDKNYIAFLNLLGTCLEPPQAATGSVTFDLTSPPGPQQTFTIKAGTEVAKQHTGIKEAVVYWTDRDVDVLPAELQWILNTNNKEGDDWKDQSKAVEVDGSDKTQFQVWPTNPPTVQQAFALGFRNDLSAHTVVVEFTCVSNARGVADTTQATLWQWQAYQESTGKEAAWVDLKAELDKTQGLAQSEKVSFYLPDNCQSLGLGGTLARTWLRCSPVEDKSYETSRIIKAVHARTWGITVPVTNAQAVGTEILGTSNGQPSQSFSLAFGPCLEPEPLHSGNVHDEDKAEWVVDVQNEQGVWESWTRVDHFGDSSESDTHYRIDAGAGMVEFGPKILQPPTPQRLQQDGQSTNRPLQERQFGRIPPQGRQIRIRRYRIGGGRQGNADTGEVNVLRQGLPYVAGVSNRAPITGGKDAQTLEEAKLRAPARLRTQNRAVTAEDFEYWAQQVPGVGRARCVRREGPINQPEQGADALSKPGTVQLLVIPALPELVDVELQKYVDNLKQAQDKKDIGKLRQIFQIPQETNERLVDALTPRLLLTTSIKCVEPEYVWVMVQATVKAMESTQKHLMQQRVIEALCRWLHPLYGGDDGKGWPFDRGLTINKVYSLIDRIAGVEYTDAVNLMYWKKQPNSEKWDLEMAENNRIEVKEDAIITATYPEIIPK